MGSAGPAPNTFDVLVVGGGFSGIFQLHTLRAAGFNARLIEAGSALGGIWYWNCYPGARVDTAVPCYQFTADESWNTWDWRQRFPGREEIQSYMRHLDGVWDLSKDVSYESRVTQMRWDDGLKMWLSEVEGRAAGTFRSSFVVLCTGFASKAYVPPYKDIDRFRGELHHTGHWPQGGVNLTGKRVAVIGTGASGVQLIQNAGRDAARLTVFQRTPNTAIPMLNPEIGGEGNRVIKEGYQATREKIGRTFAGFDYEFADGLAVGKTEAERREMYERLFHTGGLHYWLGTWRDVLSDPTINAEAYAFWRSKTLPRILSPRNQRLLCPESPHDPFGTKRISLEQGYFEIFNRDTVELVSTRENDIDRFTERGIVTADGVEREFDVVCLACGFDSITGGITQIEIRGREGGTVEEKWRGGVYTFLGMTTSTFPNLLFTYGPQAPTAFATGPSCAELQGAWILALLTHMRANHLTTFDPTREAEEAYRKHVNEIGEQGLFSQAKSWYYGDNVPGKTREALNYMAGLPAYRERCWGMVDRGWEGLVFE